jgi:hypothetical protein
LSIITHSNTDIEAIENRSILPNDITFEDFNNYVHAVHNMIEKFGYEIRSTHSQTAMSRSQDACIYALVNTVSDVQTQLATSHSADEIAFVKRILDAMFETNNTQSREVMAIKATDAVRLHKAPKERDSNISMSGVSQGEQTQPSANTSITMSRAEELLATLVEERWLEKSRVGYYSLTPRGLMELRGYLEDTYNEPDAEEGEWQRIKKCTACKDIITVGQRCANQECNVRLHDFCSQGFFRAQSERKCSSCKTKWTGRDFVGERAARGYQHGTSSNINGTTSRRRTVVEEDEMDEEE